MLKIQFLLATVIVTFLSSFYARAELTLKKWVPKNDPYYNGFDIDLAGLNEINSNAAEVDPEELKSRWKSFLSSSNFTAASPEREASIRGEKFGIMSTILFDGELRPELMKAMVISYKEDLVAVMRLAPGAIQGALRQAVWDNKDKVYGCFNQMAVLLKPSPDCQDISRLTTLSPADFQVLLNSYIRISRVSRLSFEYHYCEAQSDPELRRAQIEIHQAMEVSNQIYKQIGTFFASEEKIKRWASLPVAFSELRGMMLRVCNGNTVFSLEMF